MALRDHQQWRQYPRRRRTRYALAHRHRRRSPRERRHPLRDQRRTTLAHRRELGAEIPRRRPPVLLSRRETEGRAGRLPGRMGRLVPSARLVGLPAGPQDLHHAAGGLQEPRRRRSAPPPHRIRRTHRHRPHPRRRRRSPRRRNAARRRFRHPPPPRRTGTAQLDPPQPHRHRSQRDHGGRGDSRLVHRLLGDPRKSAEGSAE